MQRSGYEGAPGTKMKFTHFLEDLWSKWEPGHKLTKPNGVWISNIGDE